MMRKSTEGVLLGADIGTTTLSFILVDLKRQSVIRRITLPNDSALRAGEQEAERIAEVVAQTVGSLHEAFPQMLSIGVTGQMHGVLCLDDSGKAVTPLYTWQNTCADKTCCDEIFSLTGRRVFPGYGHATLHAIARIGLLPHNARRYCTIMDYIAMRLTGEKRPIMHSSNAASLGLFDLETRRFDEGSIHRLALTGLKLPQTTDENRIVGHFRGIPVAVPIGDNQASFYGSVRNEACSALVNYGTGSQLSMVCGTPHAADGWEVRPYVGGRYLLCKCALCGGRAYALLERFFRSYVSFAGSGSASQYDVMNALAEKAYGDAHGLKVSTLFCGTREHPALRGCIAEIGEDNFTPEHLILGVLAGMVHELADGFDPGRYPHITQLIASGNAVQKNAVLQRLLSNAFRMPLHLTCQREEAAFGAALFGGVCAQSISSETAKSLIRYKSDD